MRKLIVVLMANAVCLASMPPHAMAQAKAAAAAHTAVHHTSAAAPTKISTGASLLTKVSNLETAVYGAPTNLPLTTRVSRLELATLGQLQAGSLHSRVDWLEHVVQKDDDADKKAIHLSHAIQRGIPAPFKDTAPVESSSPGTAGDGMPPVAPSIESSKINASLDAVLKPTTPQATTAEANPNTSQGNTTQTASASASDAPLKATVQQTDVREAAQTTQVPPFFGQADLQFRPPAPTQAPPPMPPPTTAVNTFSEKHAKAKAIAHGIGVGLVLTLRTAAMVAGTAAAAYANGSVGYGGFRAPIVDTCACPIRPGF